MKTALFNAHDAFTDRWDRLKDRAVLALIQGFAVIDADTVFVARDVGDGRIAMGSCRISGIDSPEIHSKRALEKLAGLLVTEVAQRWCDTGDMFDVVELHGGKYARRFVGSLVKPDGNTLAEYLLFHQLVLPYDGGTKTEWADDKLNDIIMRCNAILSAFVEPRDNHAWVMPAIQAFRDRHGEGSTGG